MNSKHLLSISIASVAIALAAVVSTCSSAEAQQVPTFGSTQGQTQAPAPVLQPKAMTPDPTIGIAVVDFGTGASIRYACHPLDYTPAKP